MAVSDPEHSSQDFPRTEVDAPWYARRPGKLDRRAFLSLAAASGVALPFFSHAEVAAAGEAPVQEHSRSTLCTASGRSVHVFSKHLEFLDYNNMAEVAAEIGFDGVDLTVRPGGHVMPERVEDDLPRAVEAVKNAGLSALLMVTGITDPADERTERILRTASGVGIREYRMGSLRYDDDVDILKSLRSHIPKLRDLATMNENFGIRANYQNHSGTRVGSPVWDLGMLLDEVDNDWVGAQYDIRHATVEGGESWPLGLRLIHPHIRTIVIKDFYWEREEDGSWNIRNAPLGKGMVDYTSYFDQLRALQIDVPISLHFEYDLPGEDGELDPAARRRETIRVMKRDLEYLRKLLLDSGME